MSLALSALRAVSAVLPFAGRNGPLMLFVGVLAGLASPGLADALRPWMAAAVFAVNLGSFLQLDRPEITGEFARPARLGGVLLWTALGVPLATWAALQVLPISPDIQAGILLYALAPPAASAAALAAMLGLNVQLALICRGFGCLLAPLALPALCSLLLGRTLQLDAWAMAGSLAVVVLGAALAAWLLRAWAGRWVRQIETSSGISVIGLLVLGVGSMQGMRAQWFAHAHELALTLMGAFAVAACLQWVGTQLFKSLGRRDAWTVGMISGQRNVTLVWVALMPQPDAGSPIVAFFAMSMVACFTLPLAMEIALRYLPSRKEGRAM